MSLCFGYEKRFDCEVNMQSLKDKILLESTIVGTDILKVDSFLNHQIDPQLMDAIGRDFAETFSDAAITKVLTIESSGIAPALSTACQLGVPLVFAKKTVSKNLDTDTFAATVHSFTKGKDYVVRVSKKYLRPEDTVLIIDDFLAKGCALDGLVDIVEASGASVAGAGIVIEKGFQEGGGRIRKKGIRVHSLALIQEKSEIDHRIVFSDEE